MVGSGRVLGSSGIELRVDTEGGSTSHAGSSDQFILQSQSVAPKTIQKVVTAALPRVASKCVIPFFSTQAPVLERWDQKECRESEHWYCLGSLFLYFRSSIPAICAKVIRSADICLSVMNLTPAVCPAW
jgi:hypothetical protein